MTCGTPRTLRQVDFSNGLTIPRSPVVRAGADAGERHRVQMVEFFLRVSSLPATMRKTQWSGKFRVQGALTARPRSLRRTRGGTNVAGIRLWLWELTGTDAYTCPRRCRLSLLFAWGPRGCEFGDENETDFSPCLLIL